MPPVASSDARNIQTAIRQEGDEIVISGHKWVRDALSDASDQASADYQPS